MVILRIFSINLQGPHPSSESTIRLNQFLKYVSSKFLKSTPWKLCQTSLYFCQGLLAGERRTEHRECNFWLDTSTLLQQLTFVTLLRAEPPTFHGNNQLGCDLWQTRPAEACALSSLESPEVHKDLLILSEWCEMLDTKQMQPMNTEILMDPYPISQTVSYFGDFPSFGCMCFHPLKS